MNRFFNPIVLFFVVVSIHASVVQGRIIGVLTESTATGTFRDDVNGDPIVASFSGAQISEQFGDVDFGSAAVFDTTSRVGEGVVEFQNGNASYGNQVTSVSRTVVDVSFENTGDLAIRPSLNSQITPAGLGIYVSGCQASNLRYCSLRDDGDYDWQDVGNLVAPGEAVVGTRFDFKVVSGEDVLFSLSGGLSLIRGDNAPNYMLQEFDGIENVLTNFRQTSPVDSIQQISFDWEATDFIVEFPDELILSPGEIGTISYITEVTTFSNAFCYDTGRVACPIAYGAFGDPIGRGGGSGPRETTMLERLFAAQAVTAASLDGVFASQAITDTSIDGIEAGKYTFNLPTFDNGVIGYRAIQGPGITSQTVASPSSLLLSALGLALALFTRKRYPY